MLIDSDTRTLRRPPPAAGRWLGRAAGRPRGGAAGATIRTLLVVCLASAAALSIALSAPAPLEAQSEATIVYLVRHAERAEDGTSDPPLSHAGQERADLVAEMLRDARITHIHTTDYIRTRSTGRPTAEASELTMELYDPRDLAGFAARLGSTPGRHLVLGHSNTTPELVEALGGDPGSPIDEMEYDRLYVVTLTAEGASTVLLRFGERFEG